MTNEEAINLIGQLRMYISGGGVIDRHLDEAVQMAIDALKELGNQSQEINNPTDCISRQVAIDICHKNYDGILDFRSDGWTVASSFEDIINSVPSTQPEPLTDKEQRIFLAAMGREEKVCEEVDKNHTREPYEDSLMKVCKEIRRKVKSVLWT